MKVPTVKVLNELGDVYVINASDLTDDHTLADKPKLAKPAVKKQVKSKKD